ncbi:sex peptide receptor-like [Pollicipes pollicipes]|uniref:sex peptide receptor-like n=1 Tax=Pollicipes pollicipes TaxID=41117 RepID=UPI0018858F51|nr:sex peptide receptor-like [Pollicipes pollicipes]
MLCQQAQEVIRPHTLCQQVREVTRLHTLCQQMASEALEQANLTENVTDGPDYCGAGVAAFSRGYRQLHGYLALCVCIFGLTTNILSIVVLTRKTMVSPTNAILAGLAIADIMVMVMYVPFTLNYYLQAFGEASFSYSWAVFMLTYVHVTQVFHTVSIWLTVVLAVWRYVAIGHPSLNREWCSMKNTSVAIVSAYIFCPILCIPSYLTFAITPMGNFTDRFVVGFSDLSKGNDKFLEKFNFWMYSVHVKLLPCIILTIFSCCLISELMKARKRKVELLRKMSAGQSKQSCAERQAVRTTRMLLAILLLFLLTEFPQGILSLMSGILGKDFLGQCYNKLGDLMDILALINSSMNFIFYCSMSTQFRSTFQHLFLTNRWVPVPLKPSSTAEQTDCTRL